MNINLKLYRDPSTLGTLSTNGLTLPIAGQFGDKLEGKVFQLIEILKTKEDLKAEFGDHILYFQEVTKRKHNVVTIAIHGGVPASDNGLRKSMGANSFRLDNKSVTKLLQLIALESYVELRIEELFKTIWNNNLFVRPASVSTKPYFKRSNLVYSTNPRYSYPNQDSDDLVTYLLYSWAYGPDYNFYGLEPYREGVFYGFGGGDFGGGGSEGVYELPDPRIYNAELDTDFSPEPVRVMFDENGQTITPTQGYLQDASPTDSVEVQGDVDTSAGDDTTTLSRGEIVGDFIESHQDSTDAVELDDKPLDLLLEMDSEPFKNVPFPAEPVVEAAKSFESPIFEEKNQESEPQPDALESKFEIESGSKYESSSVDNFPSDNQKNDPVETTSYESGVSGTSY